jgi:hypothetical protein
MPRHPVITCSKYPALLSEIKWVPRKKILHPAWEFKHSILTGYKLRLSAALCT